MSGLADELLYEHVLGSGSPSDSLVTRGVFPDGWVDRYLELLKEVHTIHHGSDVIPRRTVRAVQFASWYLPLRLEVWCRASGGSNAETAGQLSQLRTPSEFFIADLGEEEPYDGTG